LIPIGFVLLIKGADLFVGAASSLAKRLRVSDLVIGLTVVAFGTSLPELAVNVTASIEGNSGITFGNIVGSNIANILLILGVAGMIFPLTVTAGTVWREIPLSLLAAVVAAVMVNDGILDGASAGVLSRADGLVLLCLFAIFLYYSAGIARDIPDGAGACAEAEARLSRIVVMIAAGLAALVIGGKWVVDGAVRLATALGVGETVIGLTIVAVGTSLPELATSAAAAYRRNADIAVGNVVGSNIFNIFFILGVSSVIRPVPVGTGANLDMGVLVAAGVLLFVWMFTGRRRTLDRWEAVVFLALYGAYILLLATGAVGRG